MRASILVFLALFLAGAAFAATAPTSNRLSLEGKGLSDGDGAIGPRTGGETIADATVIPSLPYSDTGATCGYINDYDEVCPYSGSTAPDVVYAFTPSGTMDPLTVDLCASQYDTKVYVYAGGVGNLVACNDDAGCGYSGWQSRIAGLAVTPGVTYYIVVDGYGTSCGTYDIQVTAPPPCVVECPPGAQQEGEPPCGDNYVDGHNGGCGGMPTAFQPLSPDASGVAEMCGKSCTYLYYGLSYRDTDWYEIRAAGGTVTYQCTAEFPLLILFIYGMNCNNLEYELAQADPCVTASLSYYLAIHQGAWLWVAPTVFSGVPESDYLMEVTGLELCCPPPTPVETTTWGRIKNRYR